MWPPPLFISIHNLVGTAVTARLYMLVNGVERKVYEQAFDAAADPPGLWIINGTVRDSRGVKGNTAKQ